MRVIIDIDSDGRVRGMMLPAAESAPPPEPVSATPPPEVLEAAAKLGAVSAGPAALSVNAAMAAGTFLSSIPEPMGPASAVSDAGEAVAGPEAGRSGKRARRVRKRPSDSRTGASRPK